MNLRKLGIIVCAICAITATGCSKNGNVSTGQNADNNAAQEEDVNAEYPIRIEHAFGETVIESKPERVATISWGNHDVALALGNVPVGISKANYGVADENGLLEWTAAKYKELGVEKPSVFDDVDGIDYEAISASEPDVILAAYSGITQEEYDLLSEIAPVVAYKTNAWQTYWRDQITENAAGMGMQAEGEQLVSELETLIAEKKSEYPQLEGKTAAFFYFNPADLGKFYVYLPTDPRANYLTDLGLTFPQSVLDLAGETDSFALELSSENIDLLSDVDIIVAYGNADLLTALKADSLIGTLPAVQNESVVLVEDGSTLAASCTPSALSIPATIDEYMQLFGEAADKVK